MLYPDEMPHSDMQPAKHSHITDNSFIIQASDRDLSLERVEEDPHEKSLSRQKKTTKSPSHEKHVMLDM